MGSRKNPLPPRGPARRILQLVRQQEATMRPTTAPSDNIFDFNSLLHPGTAFEHPRDVVSHRGLSLAEKRAIPGFMGFGRVRDRIMSVTAGLRRAEGSRHDQRDP
jgi:hypothetical protein